MTTQESGAETPSLKDAPWLVQPETQAVLAALEAGGERARVVGGAVRNALIGTAVKDLDIATTAVPREIIRLCALSMDHLLQSDETMISVEIARKVK